ncbi:MAG: shikimate kinase [Flavobacteriaceae bacterium]|nr:shikimate kinase [Flavobacteriaceae bacterium]
MKISLAGYMGSGKSLITKHLSCKKNIDFFDLDLEISEKIGLSIPEIFEKKGEIFFRKAERSILEDVLTTKKDIILSLGGGTPCYYDNINLINEKSISIYLRARVNTLVERLLKEKEQRPLLSKISDEKLPEFIGQHLLERNQYYNQAKYIIDTDGLTPEEIVDKIDIILKG